MKEGHWESYAILDGLPSIDVYAILEDREGNLWFGTAGGGVSRYDGKIFGSCGLKGERRYHQTSKEI